MDRRVILKLLNEYKEILQQQGNPERQESLEQCEDQIRQLHEGIRYSYTHRQLCNLLFEEVGLEPEEGRLSIFARKMGLVKVRVYRNNTVEYRYITRAAYDKIDPHTPEYLSQDEWLKLREMEKEARDRISQ